MSNVKKVKTIDPLKVSVDKDGVFMSDALKLDIKNNREVKEILQLSGSQSQIVDKIRSLSSRPVGVSVIVPAGLKDRTTNNLDSDTNLMANIFWFGLTAYGARTGNTYLLCGQYNCVLEPVELPREYKGKALETAEFIATRFANTRRAVGFELLKDGDEKENYRLRFHILSDPNKTRDTCFKDHEDYLMNFNKKVKTLVDEELKAIKLEEGKTVDATEIWERATAEVLEKDGTSLWAPRFYVTSMNDE